MTTKWKIFWRNLEYGMAFTSKVCVVAAKLYNFVINQQIIDGQEESGEPAPFPNAPDGFGYIPHNPTAPEDPLQLNPLHNDETTAPEAGQSSCCSQFLHFIDTNRLQRPEHNIARNG